jgi:hypothetical protein
LLLDTTVLREAFEKNGFKILECSFTSMSRQLKTWNHDGRESVVLIAKKDTD